MMAAAREMGRKSFFSNAYLLLTLTALFWGGNFVLGRAVAGHVPPIALSWLRWTCAAFILGALAWPHLRRDWSRAKPALAVIVFLGIVGPGVFNTLTYIGLNHTTALNGLVLQSSGPVLIVIASFVVFGDRVGAIQGIGIAISLIGVLTVIARGSWTVLAQLRPNIGDVWILSGFAFWAIYTTFLRKRPAIHVLTFAFLTAIVASIANLPVFIWEHLNRAQLQATWQTIAAVAYVSIFPSVLSYVFYGRGVELIGPNRAGVFLHLVPLFGSGLAILFLGERLMTFHLFGFALIITGVALAARHPSPRREPRPGQ